MQGIHLLAPKRGFALLLFLALAIGLIVLPQTALATTIPVIMNEPSGIYSIRESATSPGRLDLYVNTSGVVIGYSSTDTISFTGGDGTQIIRIETSVNNVATTINTELVDANIDRLSDNRGIGHALNLTLNNATVGGSMSMENITTVITTANDNSIGLRTNWNTAVLSGGYYESVPTLTFNGSGTLTVYGVDMNASDAIMANNIIVESGTLIVDNDSRTSVDGNCISVSKSYTQNGGTVIVKAGAAERGSGLRSNMAGSHATLNDGSLTITGYNPVIGHGTTFTMNMNGGTLELTAVSGQPTFENATLAIGGASGITTGFLGTSQSAATPETAADILANYRSTSPVYSYLRLPGIPSITSPTADQTVPVQEGRQATLTVAATSPAPLSYQWMTRANSSGAWSAVAGATSATYQTPAATTADQGRQYRCVVSEAGNPAATATSPIFTLRVSSTPPTPAYRVPHTGDGGQPLLWLALCVLAGCGALAVAHKKRASRRPSAR